MPAKKIVKSGLRWLVVLTTLAACTKKESYLTPANDLVLNFPSHFPSPVYNFETDNQLTIEGVALGKALFFDPILSNDKTISCASCHFPEAAFSDPGKALSEGVFGRLGSRNSPAMFNLIWHPSFMWDGGVNHIEVMPIAPLTDFHEMDMDWAEILSRLNESEFYKREFKKVFNDVIIDDQKLLYVLTQFMATLISSNAKYDKWARGEVQLSSQEEQGRQLFMNHCNSCHQAPLFSTFDYKNNGLDSIFLDDGRALITLNPNDQGKFKIPSLRNVELTYPYMHDGRFASLDEVILHYADGIVPSPTLAEELTNTFQFSITEKEALKAFLLTLTDWEFVENDAFRP